MHTWQKSSSLTETLVCLFSEAMFGLSAVHGDEFDGLHVHFAALCMCAVFFQIIIVLRIININGSYFN